jgi:hypothetical protein
LQKEEEVVPAISEYMNAQVDGKTFKATSFVVARAGVTTSINGTFGPVSNPGVNWAFYSECESRYICLWRKYGRILPGINPP